MANTNTSDSQLLPKMLQEAVFTASEKMIADKVFTTYDMTGTPGLTAQIPVYPEIAAQERNQTTEVSDTDFTVAQVDVTAAEIQARIDVSDLLSESTIRNMGADVGQMIGSAIGEKVDAIVTSIDKKTRKLSLSIKARESAEEKQAMAEFGSSDSGASLGDILGAALAKKDDSAD